MPPADKFWAVVFSGGRLEGAPSLAKSLTLEQLFERYEKEQPPGAMEASSLATLGYHKKHLLRILGRRQAVQSVTTTELQRYINKRLGEKYRKKPTSPRTVRKEVATFRAVWNWGALHSHVMGVAPVRGLKYGKENENPPFLTWDEIEKRIARDNLSDEQAKELWGCLFLDTREIGELLSHVKENSTHPFVYPMFVFVAHTGARKSEMRRSRVDDIDLEQGEIVLREKKKSREKKITFRRVPMSDLLKEAMQEWLSRHPGGQYTFCRGQVTVARKRKTNVLPLEQAPLSKSDATHYFRHALAGSKWEVVKGFHMFRHSFASNLARKGVDERVIDELMGHLTEAMRRRYRHMFPKQRVNAVQSLFSGEV